MFPFQQTLLSFTSLATSLTNVSTEVIETVEDPESQFVSISRHRCHPTKVKDGLLSKSEKGRLCNLYYLSSWMNE